MASTLPGPDAMRQLILSALFALAMSLLTFAASVAEVPRSEFAPVSAAER